MLYETLSQPKLLLFFLLTGFISGFIFDIGNFIKFLFSNKKISNIILDFIETFLVLFFIFNINLKINYGVIRFFPIFIITFIFWLERITIGKIVAKTYLKCYSLLIKFTKYIWRKNDKTKKNN